MNRPFKEDGCYDVIVVGGGIGGLTAAYQLRNKDILVLEKEDRVGGRAFSEKVGEVTNNTGTQFFSDSDAAMVKMFDELGIERTHPNPVKVPFALKVNGSYYPDARKYFSPKVYWQFMKLVFRCYRKYRTFLLPMDDPRWKKLVKGSAKDLYKGIGSELMDVYKIFMRVTCLTKPERTSAGLGAAFGGPLDQGRIAMVDGGFQTVTDRLATVIGERVVSGAQVTEVIERDKLVHVTVTHQGKEYRVKACDAVIATPAPTVGKFMPELPKAKLNALNEVVYGPITMVSLILKKNVPWQRFYCLLNDDAIFQGGIDQTFGYDIDKDPEQPIVLNLIIAPYPDEKAEIKTILSTPDNELVAKVLADFKKVVPNSDTIEDYMIDSKVTHWPIGEIELSPEFYNVLPELEKSVGHVHFCGDYTDRLSFVDGTTISAFRVARKLGSDLVVSEEEEQAFFQPPRVGFWGATAMVLSLLLLATGIFSGSTVGTVGVVLGGLLFATTALWAYKLPPFKLVYKVIAGLAGVSTALLALRML